MDFRSLTEEERIKKMVDEAAPYCDNEAEAERAFNQIHLQEAMARLAAQLILARGHVQQAFQLVTAMNERLPFLSEETLATLMDCWSKDLEATVGVEGAKEVFDRLTKFDPDTSRIGRRVQAVLDGRSDDPCPRLRAV